VLRIPAETADKLIVQH